MNGKRSPHSKPARRQVARGFRWRWDRERRCVLLFSGAQIFPLRKCLTQNVRNVPKVRMGNVTETIDWNRSHKDTFFQSIIIGLQPYEMDCNMTLCTVLHGKAKYSGPLPIIKKCNMQIYRLCSTWHISSNVKLNACISKVRVTYIHRNPWQYKNRRKENIS